MEKVPKTVDRLLMYIYFGEMTISSTNFPKQTKNDLLDTQGITFL